MCQLALMSHWMIKEQEKRLTCFELRSVASCSERSSAILSSMIESGEDQGPHQQYNGAKAKLSQTGASLLLRKSTKTVRYVLLIFTVSHLLALRTMQTDFFQCTAIAVSRSLCTTLGLSNGTAWRSTGLTRALHILLLQDQGGKSAMCKGRGEQR